MTGPTVDLATILAGGGAARVVEVRLPADQLAELADLVAERLAAAPAAPPRDQLVSAAVVADAIGMTAPWVREHAAELGGRRMGDGPRPRWRFELQRAVDAFAASTARSAGERSPTAQPAPSAARTRRRRPATGTGVELLPLRAPREGRRAA